MEGGQVETAAQDALVGVRTGAEQGVHRVPVAVQSGVSEGAEGRLYDHETPLDLGDGVSEGFTLENGFYNVVVSLVTGLGEYTGGQSSGQDGEGLTT